MKKLEEVFFAALPAIPILAAWYLKILVFDIIMLSLGLVVIILSIINVAKEWEKLSALKIFYRSMFLTTITSASLNMFFHLIKK